MEDRKKFKNYLELATCRKDSQCKKLLIWSFNNPLTNGKNNKMGSFKYQKAKEKVVIKIKEARATIAAKAIIVTDQRYSKIINRK